MTEIRLSKDGCRYSVQCSGHAGTEAACAAVSMMCCTLAGYLHNVPCYVMEMKLAPADVSIAWRGKTKEARSAYDMTAVGFMQLAKSYPQAARIVIDDVKKTEKSFQN